MAYGDKAAAGGKLTSSSCPLRQGCPGRSCIQLLGSAAAPQKTSLSHAVHERTAAPLRYQAVRCEARAIPLPSARSARSGTKCRRGEEAGRHRARARLRSRSLADRAGFSPSGCDECASTWRLGARIISVVTAGLWVWACAHAADRATPRQADATQERPPPPAVTVGAGVVSEGSRPECSIPL